MYFVPFTVPAFAKNKMFPTKDKPPTGPVPSPTESRESKLARYQSLLK